MILNLFTCKSSVLAKKSLLFVKMPREAQEAVERCRK